MFPRRSVSTVLLVLLAGPAVAVRAAEPSAAGLDLPESLRWSVSGDVRLSAGHKDNVLLHPVNSTASDFARVEADLLAWRMPVAATDFLVYVTGTETYYADLPADARAERTWLGRAEYRYDLGDYFRATLLADAMYQEQVFDLSESLANPFRARLKVTTFSLGPTLRWEIRRPWWFEARAAWQRADYRGIAEDAREPTAALRVGRKLGKRHDLSVAWTARWKDYDTRNAYTIGGRPIADTHLAVTRHEGEVRLESAWGGAGAWKTKLTAGRVLNRDSASGYFDFNRWQGAAAVEYRRGPWSATARLRHKDAKYLVQIVGEGFETDPRRIRDDEGELKVARKLGGTFELSGEFSRERSRSNADYSSYTVNTWLVGLEAGW